MTWRLRYVWVRVAADRPVVHWPMFGTWPPRTMCGLRDVDKRGYDMAQVKNLHPDLHRCRRCRW